MGHTVDGPLVAALEGGEGLLGRPGGGGVLLGRGGGGRLDEAAVEGVLRVVVGYDNFGQFLSPQWNTGEFCADAVESSTQDPLGFFVVVILVLTEAAAAQHREQHNEQEADQGSSGDHAHALVRLKIAGAGHWITVLGVAGACLVAVDAILAWFTSHIAKCSIKASVAEAFP